MAATLQSLQGNYRVELLHREIPVVITGNGFAVNLQLKKVDIFSSFLFLWFTLASISFNLLICTLRNGFEGGRKLVLQPEKICFYSKNPPFFGTPATSKKKIFRVCRTTSLPPSKTLLRVKIKRLIGPFFKKSYFSTT